MGVERGEKEGRGRSGKEILRTSSKGKVLSISPLVILVNRVRVCDQDGLDEHDKTRRTRNERSESTQAKELCIQ